jgi:uncharacterized protein
MKIGIISDTHEEIEKVRKVISFLKEKECEELIHCGDLCAPFMIEELAKFDGRVHCILGNVGDEWMTSERAKTFGVDFKRDLLELEISGKKIAVHHYPEIAESLAKSCKYDIVFYGHNHIKDKKKIGDCWLVNPGEILGWKGNPTYAIYDTELNEVEHFDL